MNKIKNIIKWFENFDNKNINYDIIYIYFQILTKKGGHMDLRQLEKEIKEFGNETDACIVFDFGIINPLENLDFSFSLGMEEMTDIKLNRRYPNKNYCTITKKYGRKLSKVGYPYIMKLEETIDEVMLLAIRVGKKGTDNYLEMIFPLEVHLSKEKPILYIRFLIDEEFSLRIFSSRYSKDNKIESIELTNRPNKYAYKNILATPTKSGEHTLIFSNVLGVTESV